MEKEFTPYEQALALKELGFDEPCFNKILYKTHISKLDVIGVVMKKTLMQHHYTNKHKKYEF
jgi:hypothetical protein